MNGFERSSKASFKIALFVLSVVGAICFSIMFTRDELNTISDYLKDLIKFLDDEIKKEAVRVRVTK